MDARAGLRIVFIIAGAPILLANAASPATHVVRPDGNGDYPTIQQAIDACADGDIVELTDGTFLGDGNRDVDFLGKAIAVRSAGGTPASCMVDCQGSASEPHRGFIFQSGEGTESMLEGITITHGHAPDSLEYDGGGVYCYSSSPTISRCILAENSAGQGGGIYGIFASPRISDCTFSNNMAYSAGGGACFFGSANPSITDSRFLANTANNTGGALASSYSSSTTLTRCVLAGNSGGSGGAGGGGAISANASASITVAHCTIAGNWARVTGGAALCSSFSTITMEYCTVAANYSSDWGGGIACIFDASLNLSHSILWGNCSVRGEAQAQLGAGSESLFTFQCCAVDSSGVGGGGGNVAWLDGNVFENPRFCLPGSCEGAPSISGDYSLHEDSPCAPANAGDCMHIGAEPVTCSGNAIAPATWGEIKASFRR
jgi:prepilin-type processing-associated H-X9-DG protein